MKKLPILLTVILTFLVSDVFSKSRSSRSGGFGGFRSKSTPSKSYNTVKVKKSTSNWSTKKVAPKPIKSINTSKVKPKAVSKNKLDVKQTKRQASSTVSKKKYSSKKDAENAARKDLLKKNTYTSSKAPSTRPSHVPNSVTRNGRSYDVDYHPMPGGGYGYGYRDPTSGLIISLLAADMIMDAAYMRNHGYTYGPTANMQPRHTHSTHVVHHGSSGSSGSSVAIWILLITLLLVVFIAIAYYLVGKD